MFPSVMKRDVCYYAQNLHTGCMLQPIMFKHPSGSTHVVLAFLWQGLQVIKTLKTGTRSCLPANVFQTSGSRLCRTNNEPIPSIQ